MNLKSLLLAIIMVISLPLAVQAETIPTNKEYQISDSSTSEYNQQNFNYNSLSVDYEQNALEPLQKSNDNELAQRTRNRRSRISDNDKKFYLGSNIGLLIPFDDANDVGFGFPSVFGGIRFNKYAAADLEFFNYLGGTETDDLGYFTFGFLANARFTYPFSQENNSIYAFVSPGIGYGRANPTGDVADNRNLDGSGGFTFQIKSGIGYPLSDKLAAFGQVRYLNVDTEGENLDGLTLDAGAIYQF
ncbi:MAG: hypothetical protein Tsb0014_01400 [Pleurocapsa sp.]